MSKKYFWLKLKRDFFKRHDIRIIEGMPRGKETVLLYLKLLCEAVDHDGDLRFSEELPYDAQMLSTVTDTDEEVVKKGLELFQKLGLVSVLYDDTIHMNKIDEMMGFETEWAEKKRRIRDNKETKRGQSEENVLDMSSLCPRQEEDNEGTNTGRSPIRVRERERDRVRVREKEKDKEREKADASQAMLAHSSSTRMKRPTLDEVKAYCAERGGKVDAEKWYAYYESNGFRVGRNPMKDWKACCRSWERSEFRSGTQPAKKASDLPILENHYTKEEVNALESDPLADIAELLGG